MEKLNLKREVVNKLEEVLELMKGLNDVDGRIERISIDMKELAQDITLEANIEDHLENKGNTFIVADDVFLILRKGESITLNDVGVITSKDKPAIVKLNATNAYTAVAGVYEIFSAYYNKKVKDVEVLEEKEEVTVKEVIVNTPIEEPKVTKNEVEVVEVTEILEPEKSEKKEEKEEDNVFFSITPSSSSDNSDNEVVPEKKMSTNSPFGKKTNFASKKIKFHGTQSSGMVNGVPALFANNKIAKADTEAPAGSIQLQDALAGKIKRDPQPTSEHIFGANRELGYNPYYGKCFEVYQGVLHIVPKNEIPDVNSDIAEEYIWVESDGTLRIGNTITDEDAIEAITESLNEDKFRDNVANVVIEVLEDYVTSV